MDKSEAMSGVELLPCPFCGGNATMWGACGQAPEQWVKCDRCAASGDTSSGEDRAAKKWNRRAPLAMLDERALIVAWLREDAKQCDCFARGEGECTCGAWWDNKESNVLNLAGLIEAGEHMK